MKNFLSILTLVLFTTAFTSCSGDDDNSTGGNQDTPGFFYAENGATTMQTVDTPYANGAFNSIFAVDASNTIVEINLTSLNAGTYAIGSGNAFTYLKPGSGSMWAASAGTVVITANAAGKLSGTFDITAGSGITGVNSVSGHFTDITVNP